MTELGSWTASSLCLPATRPAKVESSAVGVLAESKWGISLFFSRRLGCSQHVWLCSHSLESWYLVENTGQMDCIISVNAGNPACQLLV